MQIYGVSTVAGANKQPRGNRNAQRGKKPAADTLLSLLATFVWLMGLTGAVLAIAVWALVGQVWGWGC